VRERSLSVLDAIRRLGDPTLSFELNQHRNRNIASQAMANNPDLSRKLIEAGAPFRGVLTALVNRCVDNIDEAVEQHCERFIRSLKHIITNAHVSQRELQQEARPVLAALGNSPPSGLTALLALRIMKLAHLTMDDLPQTPAWQQVVQRQRELQTANMNRIADFGGIPREALSPWL
jgi:hypothetical protein